MEGPAFFDFFRGGPTVVRPLHPAKSKKKNSAILAAERSEEGKELTMLRRAATAVAAVLTSAVVSIELARRRFGADDSGKNVIEISPEDERA